MSSWSTVNKKRLMVVSAAILVFWLALEVHLFRLQVLQHDRFMKISEQQYEKRIPLHAVRGMILDRNGNRLVSNSLHYDLAVDPKLVKNREKLVRLCAQKFHRPEKVYRSILQSDRRFRYLARKVPAEEIRPILALKDRGIIKSQNFRRQYPYGTLAAQLLGFTDPDDNGLGGVELLFNEPLKGKDGEAVLQYDGPRRVFYNADKPIVPPRNGANLYLTIDKNIQTVVEDALREGVRRVKARAGMVVVLDPYSGAVLAMANYPTFDPNRHQNFPLDSKRNRCITDVYEPGSTMKMVTASILLQEQLKSSNDIVFCNNGSFTFHGRVFHDTKKHGWLTLRKVVEKSSNIGMIKFSQEISKPVFFRYLKNFGFGAKTGIGLPGEAAGLLDVPSRWSLVTKASISIGYGIGVTTLQMAVAYAAMVNGGYIYRPYVVSHLQNSAGEIIPVSKPMQVRQVLSKEVSEELKSFMRGVVERGTGKKARIDNIVTGGKTGTARKMNPKTGKYSARNYMASFIGFAPYDRPRYVCAVVIDEPRTTHYGGEAAAPVFREIIRRIVPLNPLSPSESEPQPPEMILTEEQMDDLPDLTGFDVQAAVSLLEQRNIDYKVQGDGAFVQQVAFKDETVLLKTGQVTVKNERVPNLVGKTLREAMARLDLSRFKIVLKGKKKGLIRKQSLSPGTPVKRRVELVLTCAD